MDPDRLDPVARHTHRGLRWRLMAMVATLGVVGFAVPAARTNPLSAGLVVLCGVGLLLDGHGLRAAGAVLNVAPPPPPRWLPWTAAVTVLAGALVTSLGMWLLFGYRRAAP